MNITVNNNEPKNVVIYARVSTEHEAQLSALENQLDWYKPLLEQHPEWTLVRCYVDEGITGTSAKKRPKFMQMLSDAKRGEFSLILTREVSRFARNTVDTLQYTRELKSGGVEVYFINDNIRTFDGDGELRLTIMATLAQDESRKTSVRVKSGQQTSMENGTFYGSGNILGYDRKGKMLVINPEQARTVRKIYDMYLEGHGVRQIQFKLEEEGFLTSTGKSRWYESNISKVLKNPFYAGIIEYHKQYTPDFLEQKKINNFGEVEKLRVQGSHEPIVTVEEWNTVQSIMEGRRKKNPNNKTGRKEIGQKQPADVWGRLLICSCNHAFNRKVWHRKNDDEIQYGYMCYSQIRNGTVNTRLKKGLPVDGICKSQMIPGWKLQLMAKHIFRNFLSNTSGVLELAAAMLEKHIQDKAVTEDNSDLIEIKYKEIEKLEKRLDNLIEMRADGEISRETFNKKKTEIEEQISAAQDKIKELSPYNQKEEYEEPNYQEKITVLKYALEQYTDFSTDEDIPENVIEAFVEKIVVNEDSFDWYLRFSETENNPKNCSISGKKGHAEVMINSPSFADGNTGCYR